MIKPCVLPGCGPPPAVISSDIESNNHATNHAGSFRTHSVDWKERDGLLQLQCWFTTPGFPHSPRADLCRLCGFVCQEIKAACGTRPGSQWKDDLTAAGLFVHSEKWLQSGTVPARSLKLRLHCWVQI